jgi:pimeloyl-ACP methyl ester carboxylesterase
MPTLEHAGCRFSYTVRGNGPPVLMIQGVGVHGDGWRPQVDAIAREYRCLSFDNRGMGDSQPIGCDLTVEQMADDARALLLAEGWDAAHVVGHSLGGLVAIQLALSHREMVRSLALLCTFADGRIPTRMTPWMIWVGMRTRIGPRAMRRRAFLRFVMPPQELQRIDYETVAAELAPLFGHDLADSPPVAMKQLGAMKRIDATPRLRELAGIPTLVVSAAHDPIAPPSAGKALAAGIPGARYVEFADASHGLPIHQARRINEMLLEHFRGVDSHVPDFAPEQGSSWVADA